MIITQAPVRISFMGGGSDFPDHFLHHGGAVLATAIDRFAYVTVQPFNHPFFDHRLRIAYRRTEAAKRASEVQHPAIRACLEKLGIDEGIELHHMADLPARTGLGSSSSFVVAMLQALHAHEGRFRSAQALALEAIDVERHILKEAGGYQDQILAAHGGTCIVHFNRSSNFTVSRLPLTRKRIADLEAHILLLYTGIQRDSFEVLRKQVARTSVNHEALNRMSTLAEEAAEVLTSDAPVTRFGELLHQNWVLKKGLSDLSLPSIDDAYEAACRAGASGGKVLGAGQGGFLLLIAPPDCHEKIRKALPHMLSIHVGINAPGSRVIFAQGDR